MKNFSFSMLALALSVFVLSSCGSFMSGLASGIAGYGGGGYYVAPSYNAMPTPATVWTAPNDFSNVTWTSAPAYTTPVVSGSGVSYSTGSSSTATSSSSSSSSRSCSVCYGLGKCRTCNGKGYYFDELNGNNKKCPNCTNGSCTSCGGSGKKN